MKKILSIFVLCAFVVLLAGARNTDVPQEAYEWYPKYVTFLPEAQIDSVLPYADTDIVPVVFKVNEIEFETNPQLKELTDVITKVLGDERVKLAYVWIGGSASPDGPLKPNIRLGDRRGKALASYITTHTSLPTDKLHVENLGEDWTSITRKIENSDISCKQEVLEVIKSEPDFDKREAKLKAMKGCNAWAELRDNIFPAYRNARMVIVCHAEEIKVPEPEPEPEPLPEPEPEPKPEPEPVVEIPVLETRFFAAKTNLLFGAATIANVGFEMELGRKWSIDIPFYYSPYNISPTRKLRVMATQPELRRWLTKAGEGHFFGLHGTIAGFNVAINDHGRYQDPDRPMWGFGLGYGYALNFGVDKKWGLEFNVGFGFVNYEYDVYYNRENGQKFRSGEDWWWGPTRAGITLTYKWWVPRKPKMKEVNL